MKEKPLGTDILDSHGKEVCVGNYVKLWTGSAAYNGIQTEIYQIYKIILHKGRFLLGQPTLKNAIYNIWEDGEVEIIVDKYSVLCKDGIKIDTDFKILGCPDAFREDKEVRL